MIQELDYIEKSLRLILVYLEEGLVITPQQTELFETLDLVINSCRETINTLAEEVTVVTRLEKDEAQEDVRHRVRRDSFPDEPYEQSKAKPRSNNDKRASSIASEYRRTSSTWNIAIVMQH